MNGDIVDIKRGLNSRIQSVVEYLLPRGRRDGHEWRVGSVGGEAGQSLAVHLSGDKAGVWADFNGGQGGDLLDLWCAVRNVKLAEAIDQARSWLGLERPKPYRNPEKNYTRPARPSCVAPQGRVLDYLREERMIPQEIITAYKIGERGDEIIFPFLLPDGALAMAKARKAEDGAAPKPTAANCEPVLFGWQAIPDDAREVVLTEGEIDALSMAAYGFPALSLPYGGGGGAKQQWIENEFERMDRFERIFIATDMDKPGEEAAAEIAGRLGRHRCLRVQLPKKDANDCLVSLIEQTEIAQAIAQAIHLDPEGLRRPTGFTDDVGRLFWPEPEERVGYQTPFTKLAEQLIFRPAELTLWSGASGAGKSQLLSHCMVDWVRQGSRICLSSLEMKPAQTLKRMCKQVTAVDRPTIEAITQSLRWLDRGLLLYELVGKSGIDGLLEIFSYARAKYGCDQFVIDSLMRLGIEGDDYSAQEKALYKMVDWVITNNVHLHLVAHSRKSAKDTGVPEGEDIKGAMEIGANAFNIITVWRNRDLEEKIRNGTASEDEADRPTVMFNVAKQRNGDFEGRIGLWFDKASYQYQSSYERSQWRRCYLPASMMAA